MDSNVVLPAGSSLLSFVLALLLFFNITGAYALVLGALFSAFMFMPKRRVIRYSTATERGFGAFVASLAIAPLGIVVNFLASLPATGRALVAGRLNSRVPATFLIAVGALVPAITSGANRFGETSAFFVGEFLGVLFLLSGFLVSIEVVRDIRIPLTGVVLFRRGQA